MKRMLSMLLACCSLSPFAFADASHASVTYVKKNHQHHKVQKHHAHKVAKHHANRHRGTV